jgi:hypothetical protein
MLHDSGSIFRISVVATAIAAVLTGVETGHAEDPKAASAELEALRAEVAELRRRDDANRKAIESLQSQVEALARQPRTNGARNAALPAPSAPSTTAETPSAALDAALAAEQAAQTAPPAAGTDLWSQRVGGATVRLMDVSLAALVAGGWSSVGGDSLEDLEAGAHDPNKRGFTLQQAELSFLGAVDPYFTAESHVVASEEGVELEEAFATTSALPHGFQVEAGYFLTEFGVINPRHPHQWDWLDQPVVNSRIMGGEGLRSAGFRAGWLVPVPWFSQLEWGLQSADADCCTDGFLGETVAGRPKVDHNVNDPLDLLWLGRFVNSWDLTPATTVVAGVSTLYGPNSTGASGSTSVYGLDFRLKWRPPGSFRGFPYMSWQTELMKRRYKAAGYTAGTASEDPDVFDQDLPGETLEDYGGYTQALLGFRHGWAAGLRAEYASGSGLSVEDGAPAGRTTDPTRDDRLRLSPLVTWWPSHFSRLRLQYNYDHARSLDGDEAHTVWLGLEVGIGAHPAHDY